ncbi:helix-turn-helix domain-containing protein [Spirillospora sp. CA-294931]|uniref:helix-turn-helix domain-containing protein n=1 Tax=Spirillospora sp. CA-294931 TaxID=3240042 RepID=UPI003D8F9E74
MDPDSSFWDWIAVELRLFRELYNLTGTEVAEVLGLKKSSVSNLEAGRTKLSEEHAEKLDRRYGSRGHFQRLVRLATTAHDPDWFGQFTRYERQAVLIKAYFALVVPGLFQTPEYARALIVGAQVVDDVDHALDERLRRQEILRRTDPPELQMLIKQSALEDPIGGGEVMRAQLAHLIEVSHLGNVILRIVPRSARAHPGVDGSFTLLSSAQGEHALSEAVGGGRLVSDPAKVRDYRRRFDRLGADALSRDSTRSLLAEMMEAMQ